MKYQIEIPVTGFYERFTVEAEDIGAAKDAVFGLLDAGDTGVPVEAPERDLDSDTWGVYQD